MEFLVRERRGLKILLVKLSVIISSSFTGYMISRRRFRWSCNCVAKPCGGLKEVLYLHKNGEEDLAKVVNSISIFMPNKEKEETWLRSLENYLRIHEEIKNLETKLHSKIDDANEKISNLDRRVEVLREKLRRSVDLENEVVSPRMRNLELPQENLGLIMQSEMTQISFSEAEKAIEEADHLRRENENLKKDIERLKTDRCMDVEQSIYLKWVNACLRYELRNYKSPSDIITAKDLSKSASPNSQEKAKLLILQYSSYNAEFRSENKNATSFCKSIEEHDEAHVEKNRSLNPNKIKFLSKFDPIMKGGKEDRNDQSVMRRKASVASFPFEEDLMMENDIKMFDRNEEETEEVKKGEMEHVQKENAEPTRFANALKRSRRP